MCFYAHIHTYTHTHTHTHTHTQSSSEFSWAPKAIAETLLAGCMWEEGLAPRTHGTECSVATIHLLWAPGHLFRSLGLSKASTV